MKAREGLLQVVDFVQHDGATDRRTRHHGTTRAVLDGLDKGGKDAMLRQARAQYSADLETTMGRMTRLRLIEVGLALVLTVVACFFVALAVWAQDRSEIAISGAWARPTIGEGRVTAAYMTIGNAGSADDVLAGVTSPQAARVEIHETKMTDDGVMTMRPLASGLAVPAGGSVSLKPGGAHVMVMGLEGG
ncbi:MAG: hypothetical protein A49_10330 [Methyloceanibacter sp.]|nr:MAG: hypothetical protein A49_10330 [Methyloceanibacter sp.]